jgi:hypothetical protein
LSPNEKTVLTGTGVRKGHGVGKLMGYSTLTGEKICDEGIS